MKKVFAILCTVLMLATGIFCAGAENQTVKVTTSDKLVTIELPNNSWYQLITDEHTEMFSDGDCAIMIDLYKAGDKLPAIETADKNHELIYTAAVSTQDYVMVVLGYAHARSDFSTVVKAINTIELYTDKITDNATSHEVKLDAYSIRSTWYTAWVSAELLNVRAGTNGTESAILTTLTQNTRLTVTGTVLKNGVDVGWSAVTLQNGTTGYVYTAFLTTIDPASVPTQTGATCTLYTAAGNATTLFQYSDGSWKTASGIKYWLTTSGNYTNEYGDVLFVENPFAAPYRTGYCRTLYNQNNAPVYIYEYSDGTWQDDYGMIFMQISSFTWENTLGESFSLEPHQTGPVRSGDYKILYSENNSAVYIYAYTDGSWQDDNGMTYTQISTFTWENTLGETFSLEPHQN